MNWSSLCLLVLGSGLLAGRAPWHMQEVASSVASAPQTGLEGLFPGCKDMGCLWSC